MKQEIIDHQILCIDPKEETAMPTPLKRLGAFILVFALLLSCVPCAQAGDIYSGFKPLDQIMYIKTGNNGGLNLRQGPSTLSGSLGLYENGTKVHVLGEVNGWAYTVLDGKYGFMMMQYLTSTPVTETPTVVPTEDTPMYIQTGNTGKLNLRQYASTDSHSLGLYPNGTKVVVKARFGIWAYVTVDKKEGYMLLQFLTAAKPPVTQTPTALPTGASTMYVKTGNSGKLHLRQWASSDSASLGLYPNGTKVSVISVSGAWAYVVAGGKLGYMMLAFLDSGEKPPYTPEPGPSVPPLNTTMYIQTGNTGKLNLREGPGKGYASLGLYPNGTKVKVTAITAGTWANVIVDGKSGYMLLSCLTAVEPPVTPVPPTDGPITPTTMYVQTGNTGKLYLREKPSKGASVLGKYPNGTKVTVLGKTGAWAQVNVDGKTGYMMLQYLTTYTPTPKPSPTAAPTSTATGPVTPTPSPAPTAVPGTATVVQKHNSYVYLRSTPHSSSNTNIIAKVPSGTVVKLLQKGETWSKIQYNSQTGYMLSSYLK